jgi:hypothetical protein
MVVVLYTRRQHLHTHTHAASAAWLHTVTLNAPTVVWHATIVHGATRQAPPHARAASCDLVQAHAGGPRKRGFSRFAPLPVMKQPPPASKNSWLACAHDSRQQLAQQRGLMRLCGTGRVRGSAWPQQKAWCAGKTVDTPQTQDRSKQTKAAGTRLAVPVCQPSATVGSHGMSTPAPFIIRPRHQTTRGRGMSAHDACGQQPHTRTPTARHKLDAQPTVTKEQSWRPRQCGVLPPACLLRALLAACTKHAQCTSQTTRALQPISPLCFPLARHHALRVHTAPASGGCRRHHHSLMLHSAGACR